MRRIVAATAAVAALGGATVAGSAIGQGTGGILGPKAQGSTTLQVRLTERSFGVHCADTNKVRRCLRQRNPRIAGISGGNGPVFQGDQRVGRAHFTNVVTQRGRRNTGGELFLATVVLTDGTLTLQGASQGGEDAPSIPSSITGGTGAYAGARGYATEEVAPTGTDEEFRINVTFTFIP
jgi:hypothetical protein